MIKYRHKKSGRIYEVISMNIINATNKDDGLIMVLYEGEKKDGTGVGKFVRELNEFKSKFEVYFELDFCSKCFQMTNHLDGVCQKCKNK